MHQKAYIDVCWAVTVTELNDSYSEANARTCIKITKLVSVFVGSSFMARSQASVAPGGRKSNSGSSIFLKRVLGWEKIYLHMDM